MRACVETTRRRGDPPEDSGFDGQASADAARVAAALRGAAFRVLLEAGCVGLHGTHSANDGVSTSDRESV